MINPARFDKRKRVGGGKFGFASQINCSHAAQRGAACAHCNKKGSAKDKTKPTIITPTGQRQINKEISERAHGHHWTDGENTNGESVNATTHCGGK